MLPSGGTRRVAPHALWNVGSQLANSGGNLLLTLLVARNATPRDLGIWSIAYVTYTVILNLYRGSVFTPILLRTNQTRREISDAYAFATTTATALGGLLAGLALLLDAPAYVLLLVTILPVLVVQDLGRYAAFATSAPWKAAVSDMTWLCFVVVAIAAQTIVNLDPFLLTAIWGAGAGAGTVVSLALAPVTRLTFAGARRFFALHRNAVSALALESSLATTAAYSAPFLVALIAGFESAGAFRAAVALMGGVSILVGGLIPLITTNAAHRASKGEDLGRILLFWSTIILAAGLAYGAALLSMPDRWGVLILGSNWYAAAPLLLPLTIQALFRGPITAVPVLLRAQGAFHGVVQLSALVAVPGILGPSLGALVNGAMGAAWGVAAAGLGSALVSLFFFRWTARTSR